MSTIDVTTTNPLTEKRLRKLIENHSSDTTLLVTAAQYEIMQGFRGTATILSGPYAGTICYVSSKGSHPVEVKS
ncbi:MAG: hypothetical protein IKE60_26340 [Reyranella sp.]|uniref:hypothetical protein n=1 Tax=Reyranella sp. TaxID=1929291 RepID=UPI0025EDF52B|nr:hypothetical protein [Reyranella sp.]MBR2818209.1 hypothetical protein [Reyranella sp.]